MKRKGFSLILAALIILIAVGCDNDETSAVIDPPVIDPPVTFTVSFDKNTEAEVKNMPSSLTVKKGSKISKPSLIPSRVNSNTAFEGWLCSDKSTLFDFANNTIIEDTILYTKWGPEIIAERNVLIEINNNIAMQPFTAEELDASDYFTFQTDGSKAGAKKNGFGGIKIGFQNNSGAYGMSKGVTTLDWTPFAGRAGKCVFVVKLSAIENYKFDSADYIGTTSGELRLYLGYWGVNISELALNGYAALVKGEVTRPLYSIDLKLKDTESVIGFVYAIP